MYRPVEERKLLAMSFLMQLWDNNLIFLKASNNGHKYLMENIFLKIYLSISNIKLIYITCDPHQKFFFAE